MPEVFEATRQAEMALLGTILIESAGRARPELMREIAATVRSDDFLDYHRYDNQHSRIFSAMLSCSYPDQIGVAQEMDRQGTLRTGDIAYMSLCIAETPCSLDYLHYARAVANYSLRRQIDYYNRKGDYDKVQELLKNHKPRFTGGIRL